MSLPQTLLYLASESPRRRQLLEQLGIRFKVIRQPIDESRQAGEDPESLVRRLAAAKAVGGLRALTMADPKLPVLGADTVVLCEGRLLGKPQNREDGLQMLSRLSGRAHEVMTAVALAWQDRYHVTLATTRVVFRPITAAEMTAYWQTGEPCDKAGGYAIQGLGALFVERLEGSYSGVVGLPLYETANLLAQSGLGAELIMQASVT
ncbi:MAG: Maf family protein [Pseudomonadales bacterium]|nr:Maf family protein [Pseudomonadales bacterium]